MLITIIAEPRSGSTNLHYWFKKSGINFISVFEPYNKISEDFKTDKRFDLSWMKSSKNYIINEKFYPECGDLNQLINVSDKVLCLYRENSVEQIESFVVANVTNNWLGEYNGNDKIIKNIDRLYSDKQEYFLKLKKDFKDFIDLHNLKSFSYEDLYYRGKIKELKEYLELDITIPFPYGKKYRIDSKTTRLI